MRLTNEVETLTEWFDGWDLHMSYIYPGPVGSPCSFDNLNLKLVEVQYQFVKYSSRISSIKKKKSFIQIIDKSIVEMN